MWPFRLLLIGLVLGAAAVPARARLVDCVGRCDDGAGNRMLVENRCDEATERCNAGCNTAGPRPYPYAECVKKVAPDNTASDGAGDQLRPAPLGR